LPVGELLSHQTSPWEITTRSAPECAVPARPPIHLRRQVRAALTVHKARVDAQLRPLGLRLQGFEVRGWRTCLLRGLWPTRPTIRPLQPLRRPQYKVSRLRPIRPPKLPRYSARRPTPAAIEERLLQVVAARDG